MNRQTLKRLMIKGTVAYVAVFSLVLMVAMPAMALIAARNSVNRRSIINGEVTYKDLAKNSVRTAKIAPRAVRYGKIASGAVRGNHIKDGHVKSADIGNGTILNVDISGSAAISASKINRTGLNADLLDGQHAGAFAASSHNHDAAYSGVGHNHNSDYLGVTGAQSLNGTLTVSGLTYSSPKTKRLSIVGAAFRPEVSGEGYVVGGAPNSGYGSIYSTSAGTRYFYAPVNLPDGAIVTELMFTVFDNYTADPSFDSSATLLRREAIGFTEMANVPVLAENPSWLNYVDGTISSATIDNNNFYFVKLTLNGTAGPGVSARGVTITYAVGAP